MIALVAILSVTPSGAFADAGARGAPYDGAGTQTAAGLIAKRTPLDPRREVQASADAGSGEVSVLARIDHRPRSLSPLGDVAIAQAWIEIVDIVPEGTDTILVDVSVRVIHAEGRLWGGTFLSGDASYDGEIFVIADPCCYSRSGDSEGHFVSDSSNGTSISFDDRAYRLSYELSNPGGAGGPLSLRIGLEGRIFAPERSGSAMVSVRALIDDVAVAYDTEES